MKLSFRILPFAVIGLIVMIGMRGLEMWTGFSIINSAHAVDASANAAKPADALAPPAGAQPVAPGAAPAMADVSAANAPAAAPTTPVTPGASLPSPAPAAAIATQPSDAKDPNIPPLAQPEAAPPVASADMKPAPTSETVAAPRPKIPGEEDFTSASEIEVLSSLTKRREELDKRAAELDMRGKLLKATEQRLDQKLAEIKAIQSQIDAAVHTLDDKQEKQIASLVKVYETMKPKDAAGIMQDLDKTILLEVAARVKDAKMALILAAMDPAKAREVTVMLAKRNQLPGKSG